MRKNSHRMKIVGLLLAGGMLLQFGGCLGGIWKQVGIGFGRSIGAIPGNLVGDLIVGFLPIGGGDDGTDGG
jgi:hypothetical protein